MNGDMAGFVKKKNGNNDTKPGLVRVYEAVVDDLAKRGWPSN
jgi:hypothetical protein